MRQQLIKIFHHGHVYTATKHSCSDDNAASDIDRHSDDDPADYHHQYFTSSDRNIRHHNHTTSEHKHCYWHADTDQCAYNNPADDFDKHLAASDGDELYYDHAAC